MQSLPSPRAGLPISGLLGGFVSSTATIAMLARRSKGEPGVLAAAAAGAALSNIATVAQLALVLAVSDAVLLGEARWPLLACGVAAAAYGTLLLIRAKDHAAPPAPSGRAFKLRTALLFAAAFTLVALLVAWLQRSFGPNWALAGVIVGGFGDAHSTSASVGSLSAQHQMTRELAVVAIGMVFTANTITKLGFARVGGARFFLRVAPGLVLMLAAFWLTWWLGSASTLESP